MLRSLISDLKRFADEDFPTSNVSNYLKELEIPSVHLKKFRILDSNLYTRNLVYRDKSFELMLICWPPNAETPIHGHEGEKCWSKVEEGKLRISEYIEKSRDPLLLEKTEERDCKPGYLDGPAKIHSVKNISIDFSTSLHLYAKPYDACDTYDLKNNKMGRKYLKYYSIDGIISSN